MKPLEQLLQEQLERLETGTSLAECQKKLPPEEAHLLALAASLRQMGYPARDPQVVQQQRTYLMQQATKEQRMTHPPLTSRPRWAIPAIGVSVAAAFLFLCLVVTAIGSGSYFRSQAIAHETVLNHLAGVVEIQRDGTWTAVSQAAPIQVGEHIRTGTTGKAVLALPDGSLVFLGPDTELWIAELNVTQEQRLVRLAQWSGETRHDVAHVLAANSVYEVETPSGTSTAKGTIFSVMVAAANQTRVSVVEGLVQVSGQTGVQAVSAGKMSTVLLGHAPQSPAFVVTGEGTVIIQKDSYYLAGQTFFAHNGTVIAGEINSGDTVYMEGHVSPEGYYLLDFISPERTPGTFLGDNFTGGPAAFQPTSQLEDLTCVSVASVIVAIDGDDISLENGTTVNLNDLTLLEGTPAVGAPVLLITCTDDAGNVVLLILIVLAEPPGEPTPTPSPTIPVTVTVTPGNGGLVTLCHYPPGNPANAHTITVGAAAVPAHLAHGDTLGPCANGTPTVTPTVTITPTPTITVTPPVTVTPPITVTPTITATPPITTTPVPPTPVIGDLVTICHVPPGNPNNTHTIVVGAAAVPAHLAHGDTLGPCPEGGNGNGNSGNPGGGPPGNPGGGPPGNPGGGPPGNPGGGPPGGGNGGLGQGNGPGRGR